MFLFLITEISEYLVPYCPLLLARSNYSIFLLFLVAIALVGFPGILLVVDYTFLCNHLILISIAIAPVGIVRILFVTLRILPSIVVTEIPVPLYGPMVLSLVAFSMRTATFVSPTFLLFEGPRTNSTPNLQELHHHWWKKALNTNRI